MHVNGETSFIGQKADPEVDEITVDGRPLTQEGQKRYLMLNKPRGYVCTLSDEKGRKTVAELVKDCGERVYPVGRLDLDSEGLSMAKYKEAREIFQASSVSIDKNRAQVYCYIAKKAGNSCLFSFHSKIG